MKKIELVSTSTIVVVEKEQVSIDVSSIDIVHVIDDGISVVALLQFTDIKRTPYTLWEGDSYEKIGQWTDTDVEKRVLEILKIK